MLVIDGHNLIPKIHGWSLREIDDEARLIELLQRYASAKRKALLVFFDGAPPGYAGEKKFGLVTARFVQVGTPADNAILHYLVGLKKGAKNVSVVSSDHMVQANAREQGAKVIPSEDFARELVDLKAEMDFAAAKARGRGPGAAATGTARARDSASPPASTGRSLNEWYDLFDIDPDQAEKPIELKPPPKPKPAPKKSPPSRPSAPSRGTAPRKHHGFPKKKDG